MWYEKKALLLIYYSIITGIHANANMLKLLNRMHEPDQAFFVPRSSKRVIDNCTCLNVRSVT